MKRFFPILLAVMLVVFSAVPAFAVANPDILPVVEDAFTGTWLFNSSPVAGFSGTQEVPFTSNGQSFVGFYVSSSSPLKISYYPTSTADPTFTVYSNGVWVDEEYKTLNFGSVADDVYKVFYDWFTVNATQIATPECDGSTCPATDMNFDDVCDDCGYILAYDLRVSPNSYEIVVKHSDTMTLLYRYTETLAGTTFNAVYSDESITVSFDNPVNHEQFRLVDGEWVTHASYPNEYDNHAISLGAGASIVSSDLDVYNTDGSFFFKNPLWMEMEQVTQGGMSGLTQTMGGTMKVLVLCGVGLMASLVVLSLFGRRSLIFRR